MAFGPIMHVQVNDELLVELAPLHKDDMGEFVSREHSSMQNAKSTKYLKRRNAFVFEDELEWFEKTRVERDSIVWGIYAIEGDERTTIGSTAIHNIDRKHIHRGTTGSMIFRDEYWGRKIASAIHRARTWFAFQHLGLHVLKSVVLQPNHASRKALMKSGYEIVGVERNTDFIDGQLLHQDHLECLNPNEPFWTQWWHGERIPTRPRAARQRTLDAFEWVKDNVTLL